jgi:predicted patatin/cPLA2 family phospholipase
MPLLLDLEVKLERCWRDAGGRENIDVVRRKMKSISLPPKWQFLRGKTMINHHWLVDRNSQKAERMNMAMDQYS